MSAGAVCLLIGLSVQSLAAQEKPAFTTPKVETTANLTQWVLGVSRFYQVSPEVLAATAVPEFTVEKAREVAGKATGGPLSIALPSLLSAALPPFPHRTLALGEGGNPASIPVSFKLDSGENNLVDISKGADAFAAYDGIVAGFYVKQSETIACRIFFFEKGKPEPVGSKFYEGSIASLETMATEILPPLLSWVANRAVGIVDIKIQPSGGGATLELHDTAPERATTGGGKRLFVFESGDYEVSVGQKGFEPSLIQLRDLSTGSYRSISVELTSSKTLTPAGDSFASATDALKWKEESVFRSAEKKYRSAMGRFVLSVPFSAIAIGAFFSYLEAYSRAAASQGALYASGGITALCLSLNVGFIIDTAIKLVDVLHASR